MQTVCTECHALKMRACEGCDFGCYQCPYAFPETGLNHIFWQWFPGDTYEDLMEVAREKDSSPQEIIASVVGDYLQRKRKLIVGITGTAFY